MAHQARNSKIQSGKKRNKILRLNKNAGLQSPAFLLFTLMLPHALLEATRWKLLVCSRQFFVFVRHELRFIVSLFNVTMWEA